MFQGNICWIWAHLAGIAVAGGADLFVLLGDDVHMLSDHWQSAVEHEFMEVAQACMHTSPSHLSAACLVCAPLAQPERLSMTKPLQSQCLGTIKYVQIAIRSASSHFVYLTAPPGCQRHNCNARVSI